MKKNVIKKIQNETTKKIYEGVQYYKDGNKKMVKLILNDISDLYKCLIIYESGDFNKLDKYIDELDTAVRELLPNELLKYSYWRNND